MGIFDKLLGSKDVKLTPNAALALAAMTIVAADGSIDQEESAGLVRILRGDRESVDLAIKLIKAQPLDECIKRVAAALDEKQRKCVAINIIDLAMADGVLAGNEQTLLTKYMAEFQLSEDFLKSVVDVISVKNDFSVMK